MEKGNVRVLGNAGVGKTALINAVLGQDLGRWVLVSRGPQRNRRFMKQMHFLSGSLTVSDSNLHFHATSGCRIGEEMDQRGY